MGKDGDQCEMYVYNGYACAQMSDPYGLKKLGAEKLKPLFTRGHLVDLVPVKGGMMDSGQEIMAADIRAALQRQNIQEGDIKPRDAIFFNTDWGSPARKHNDPLQSGEPWNALQHA